MSATRSQVRPGAYFDSAVLMKLQRSLLELPGVEDAGAVMATPANCDLLEQSRLLPAESGAAGANDLMIVVRAATQAQAEAAVEQVDSLLARRGPAEGPAGDYRPRSLESAARQSPDAAWVLISVPGRYAAGVAREALQLGRHVFLYSDNVSLEDEIALKQAALARGLLVMGPDCGTAIVNGVGLGFANRVRRGAIGMVGASGTGLQAISARIHTLGAGVSHALGAGGRDLKEDVGAVTARQSLDLLARDPGTRVIVLVSKPPAPAVAASLLAAALACGKPVVVDFIGYPLPARRLGSLHFAASLSEAAELAVALANALANAPAPAAAEPVESSNAGGFLRGLFSGGTLAYEALLGVQPLLAPLYSNAPVYEHQRLPDPLRSQAHTILDLGEDVFTVGRLHPMMDNDLRLRRLRQEAADPDTGLILLDVVLGEGAHPNPASELAPGIRAALESRPGLDVAAILIGTDADPQDIAAQAEQLQAAGARVFTEVGPAVEFAVRRLSRAPAPPAPPVGLESLAGDPLSAINAGLESFHDSLLAQGARSVHVDWRPPAGGNEKLAAILARMKK